MTPTIEPEAAFRTLEFPAKTSAAPGKPARPNRPGGLGGPTMIAPSLPDLHPVKDLLMERVYQDFCRQREHGETTDADQYCERFPSIRSDLIKLVQCHLYLADNSAMAGGEENTIVWPEIGETFLGFELLQVLGAGGFARVFLASEPRLGNRLVAVKIAKHLGHAEAKVLGKLRHPNIVPVHSIQDDAATGLSAVCMDYAGSATLDDVLAHVFAQPTPRAQHILEAARQLKHPLDANAKAGEVDPFLQRGSYVDAVRSLGARLADALAFIHGVGICHRDLKPSNVLISPQGVPMLLDFNLSIGVKDLGTYWGGTLPYMSPEQLQAGDPALRKAPNTLDGRSDIFSFGVIFYQLLTGRHPYGPAAMKVHPDDLREVLLQRHLQGVQDPRRLNPAIDPALSRLIQQCLAFDPADRPQSAAEIAETLRGDLTPQRRARRWVTGHPRALVASLLLSLTLGLVGAAAATVLAPRRDPPLEVGVRLFQEKKYAEARDEFTKALLANPEDASALFARARTYQQMGSISKEYQVYWDFAVKDFIALEQLKPSPRQTAGAGYGILQMTGSIEGARLRFQAALDGGFATAELYNNLGYCQQQQNRVADALTSLDRAIKMNPRLQAAYHTRALVRSQQARSLCDEFALQKVFGDLDDTLRASDAIQADILKAVDAGLDDVKKALAIGPVDANLHFQAASFHAIAANYGRDAKGDALNHLQEAVKRGLPAALFQTDATFQAMFADERFQAMLTQASGRALPTPAARFIDPLNGGLR